MSEQELVDCSTSFGNQGCNGGLMDSAFKYSAQKGIASQSDYKYTAKDGSCKSSAHKRVFKNSGFKQVARNNPNQLAAAITQQVVSVAVQADQQAFRMYKSGIISSGCGTKLNHGIAAVGYTADYWIVRNSWGTSWGESGYGRIKRDKTSGPGVCGINMDNSYPI